MRFSVWPNARQPWSEVLETARHAEDTGWDGVWFADHFMPNAEDVSQPTLECWTVLAGLSTAVPRVRLGALVSGNTYRHPAVLANMAATTDHLSGGRVVLGLGAGWQENEHAAYGIPLPPVGERLARFEEACRVVKGLLTEERTTFEGRFYTLRDAPCEPKPLQRPLPLLVGGGGEKVTMRIAARWADEWNVWGTPDVLRHKIGVLDGHCAEADRDPSSVRRSCQALLVMTDDADALAQARGRRYPMPALVGTVDDVRAAMADYAEAGVDEFIVPDFTLTPGDAKKEVLDTFLTRVAADFR
jgi:F420-dependent oxidoreductase-like protein